MVRVGIPLAIPCKSLASRVRHNTGCCNSRYLFRLGDGRLSLATVLAQHDGRRQGGGVGMNLFETLSPLLQDVWSSVVTHGKILSTGTESLCIRSCSTHCMCHSLILSSTCSAQVSPDPVSVCYPMSGSSRSYDLPASVPKHRAIHLRIRTACYRYSV
ncbi:hypothetical protein DAEQUDRAFT_475603 [Daedalea quercina L-15889]|uniref:Uncharacterized protein n=1 Tax=Daedalea quercina L-15889 TaxID=1314783 RepID=A0A165MXN4_9APHY|nr:hypothetical protein DAEQUDRAFT_475603 [Daedalea quercina L-15889]